MAYSAQLSPVYRMCTARPSHTRLEELDSCLLDSRSGLAPDVLASMLHMAAAAFSSLLVPCSMHLLFPYFISDLLLLSPNQEGNAQNDRPADQPRLARIFGERVIISDHMRGRPQCCSEPVRRGRGRGRSHQANQTGSPNLYSARTPSL